MSPLRSFLLAQALGAIIAASGVQIIWPKLFATPLWVALVQGCCAAMASYKLEAERWWLPIHVLFLPLAVLLLHLDINPLWYLGIFVFIFLIYWRTDKSRVPLYLSNHATAETLLHLLPTHPVHVIDLGCGSGSLLRHLARARPDCDFLGIEHAPLTWLWAWLGSLRIRNLRIRYGDFWQQPLGLFEVVYAFLSPTPMPALWQKAQTEMRTGTRLISNSFAIPEIEAENIVKVEDKRETALYCYRLPDSSRG